MTNPFPGREQARHMGELRRGERRWDVYLESEPAGDRSSVRGRIHFVAPGDHRTTGWIFLELGEREVRERFGEFSAVELWHFLEALEPRGSVAG
ncbi:MAG TPA: hypothetical protein VNX15_04135 [Gemmatimonadales bacterium]|jgi:hypothetical protein|nr:hypothetical protein [Gemmatimonadales bacterium]